MYIYFYEFEFGKLGIVDRDDYITNVYFSLDDYPENAQVHETPLLKRAGQQLASYFRGELKEFSLPLAPEGSDFMQKVWKELQEIPYGQTATYKDIAIKVGSPKAARAVGLANNRNPIPIFIPCHRVIGSDGSLVGYRGGLDLKERLLDIEKEKKTTILNMGTGK